MLAAAIATPIALLGAQSALAAWSQQAPPWPAGALAPMFTGVSCASPAACMAIGTSQTKTASETFTESWDGTGWTIQPVAEPKHTSLRAVSCSSPDACTAVGSSTASGTAQPLAEWWDGTAWTAQIIPSAAEAALSGVSCPSATRCVAIGGNSNTLFSENWNGSTWAQHSMPVPAGSRVTEMNAVSCRAGKSCEAVGVTSSATDNLTAWSWNGSKWSVQAVPLPSGVSNGDLYAVSCSQPSECLAVGSYHTPTGPAPLAELWNGTAWTVQATAPLPPTVQEATLGGVSCVPTGTCVAGGTAIKYGHGAVLGERWTGSRFVVLRSVVDSQKWQTGSFAAVSCPTRSDCTAAGYYQTHKGGLRLLAEQEQG